MESNLDKFRQGESESVARGGRAKCQEQNLGRLQQKKSLTTRGKLTKQPRDRKEAKEWEL